MRCALPSSWSQEFLLSDAIAGSSKWLDVFHQRHPKEIADSTRTRVSMLLIKLHCRLQRKSGIERHSGAVAFAQPDFNSIQQLGGYSRSGKLRQHGHSAQVPFSTLAHGSGDGANSF